MSAAIPDNSLIELSKKKQPQIDLEKKTQEQPYYDWDNLSDDEEEHHNLLLKNVRENKTPVK